MTGLGAPLSSSVLKRRYISLQNEWMNFCLLYSILVGNKRLFDLIWQMNWTLMALSNCVWWTFKVKAQGQDSILDLNILLEQYLLVDIWWEFVRVIVIEGNHCKRRSHVGPGHHFWMAVNIDNFLLLFTCVVQQITTKFWMTCHRNNLL